MSTENMKLRIKKYMGGSTQLERMNRDKLLSLKQALLYSYQAATAVLSDGREFRCLINPNKLNPDTDDKIISIPFRDVVLNGGKMPSIDIESPDHDSEEGVWEEMEDLVATLSLIDTTDNWEDMVPSEDVESLPHPDNIETIPGGEQEIGLKEGDLITWKENGTHWIVYLRYLEETAYFRANLRRCRHYLELGNNSGYWAYVRGPVEQSILWSQVSGNYFNRLNYTLSVFIPQNEETLKYFSRFKKVMINNKPWEVQAVDSISTPGILSISLKETYSNTIETDIEKVIEKIDNQNQVPDLNIDDPYIKGSNELYPYDVERYEIKNAQGGQWLTRGESKANMVKLKVISDSMAEVQIITGKSGKFTLVYQNANKLEVASLDIQVKSL